MARRSGETAALIAPAKRLRRGCAASVLWLALLAPGASPAGEAAGAGPRELVVEPAGAIATLGEALALARDGDRIRVRAGRYAEGPLEIDRAVTIEGEGDAVIDGEGQRSLLIVLADGVTIRNLVFENTGSSFVSDRAAITVEGASDCRIEDNRLERTFFGIYLARASRCRVTGNRIRSDAERETHAGNGIHLWYSSDVEIADNVIEGHRDGIYLEFAERTYIRDNIARRNLRYGLHFMFSDESRFEGNRFAENSAGVAVMYTKRVSMRGNVFEDNWGAAAYGLLLKEITDSEVRGNVFRRNTTALFSEGSDRIEVAENRFLQNGWAVKVFANSQHNRFVRNDFVANAFDVTTNSRQNPNLFVENHWSRYDGYDLDGSGYGDVPHRPVRLFSYIVERNPTALLLLRSPFVDLLDVAERVMPVLTPETLVDERPRMRELPR